VGSTENVGFTDTRAGNRGAMDSTITLTDDDITTEWATKAQAPDADDDATDEGSPEQDEDATDADDDASDADEDATDA
jgi:hypothetical protein